MVSLTERAPSRILGSLQGFGFVLNTNNPLCQSFSRRLNRLIVGYCEYLENNIDASLSKNNRSQTFLDRSSWAFEEVTDVFIFSLGRFRDKVLHYENLPKPIIDCEIALSNFVWLTQILDETKAEREAIYNQNTPRSQRFIRKRRAREWTPYFADILISRFDRQD